MRTLLLIMVLSLTGICFSQEGRTKKRSDITNCLLIEKAFISKSGEATDHNEMYLRCSMQDYFIKLCESKVTREELEKYLDRGIAVTMEIVEGEWDSCPGDEYPVQSRIGTYAIITSILK